MKKDKIEIIGVDENITLLITVDEPKIGGVGIRDGLLYYNVEQSTLDQYLGNIKDNDKNKQARQEIGEGKIFERNIPGYGAFVFETWPSPRPLERHVQYGDNEKRINEKLGIDESSQEDFFTTLHAVKEWSETIRKAKKERFPIENLKPTKIKTDPPGRS